jgi:hypothetical protein
LRLPGAAEEKRLPREYALPRCRRIRFNTRRATRAPTSEAARRGIGCVSETELKRPLFAKNRLAKNATHFDSG